jgi:uncharacterized Rmd1/YagE family protein
MSASGGRYSQLEGQRILRSFSLDEDLGNYGSMGDGKNNGKYPREKVIALPGERESKYIDDDDGNLTDDGVYLDTKSDKLSRTGRQRKKHTTRAKGGEFQTQRRKRRLYFCCVSHDIDIKDLFEHVILAISNSNAQWKAKLFGDALCISRSDPKRSGSITGSAGTVPTIPTSVTGAATAGTGTGGGVAEDGPRLSDVYNQEIFVFEFGAVVFWGFAKGEEKYMLDIVRDFVKDKMIDDIEYESSEDDMAFMVSLSSSSLPRITVANDVITLPETTTPNQRLAVSFAIAQSAIVSIFENRIERKVEEYKFIPETLSKVGKINLPIRRVGQMIGDIFVIRHDLNLHSDVLDTPDFLWEEDIYEPDYLIIAKYLEMESRVDLLNTRLDMLKELLDMIQQQMQNAHASKLEWIVIWLIVIEVGIEVIGGGGSLMGWWSW